MKFCDELDLVEVAKSTKKKENYTKYNTQPFVMHMFLLGKEHYP